MPDPLKSGRCGHCDYWKEGDQEEVPGFGYCLQIGFHDSRDHVWKEPLGKAFVEDVEGYNAGLRCLCDFGCVLFTPKEAG